jgi:MFS family permease
MAALGLGPGPRAAMMVLLALLLLLVSTAWARRAEGKLGLPQRKPIARGRAAARPFDVTLLARAEKRHSQRELVLGIALPWLYFLSSSINLTTMPKYVNWAINRGDVLVSPHSAQVYGNMGGLDAFFTFLSVSFIGRLSDRHGRKPFMALASAGLGSSYFLLSRARQPYMFYIASAIDGLTSCMLSQAQALVADQSTGDLSLALSRFQGLAIGLAFALGIPLGELLVTKLGILGPLKVSMVICAINVLLIVALRPNKPPSPVSDRNDSSISPAPNANHWVESSPLGAVKMLTRSRPLYVRSICYFLVTLAHAGMQSTWSVALYTYFI